MAHFPVARNGHCECGCEGIGPCGECGNYCEITFNVNVPPDAYWEAVEHTVGGYGYECYCHPTGTVYTGIGPETDLTMSITIPWWETRCDVPGVGCCIELWVEGEYAPQYLEVVERFCGELPSGYLIVDALHYYPTSPAWEVEIYPDGIGCYNCEYGIFIDPNDGENCYSDCVPDFTLHQARTEWMTCRTHGGTYNFTDGTTVTFVYDRYIDPCACTRENVGWKYDLEEPLPFDPISYTVQASIDGVPLDGHVITTWTSHALTFTLETVTAQDMFLGRYHVRIYGIACDDSETLVANYPGGAWTQVSDVIIPMPPEHSDEIQPGGFYGPWTPDPLAEFKGYRLQVDLEPWATIFPYGSVTDPGVPPINPSSPMATASFIVYIDENLFACP